MSRRTVLRGLGATAALAATRVAGAPPQRDRPPNFVFVLADDLGYADLSCYGRRDYRTPQLDRLAADGIRFTTAYSSSPVCSPTRAALMTGRYPQRLPVGLEEPLTTRDVGLPAEFPTLPAQLRALGYTTALVGKWHLGVLPKFGPLLSGYQHFWGFRTGAVDYFDYRSVEAGTPDLWDGDAPARATGYLTDRLGDRAVAVLERLHDERAPFLLSLHFSAPHWPWEGPDDEAVSRELAKRPPRALLHLDGGSLATYAAMVVRLDQQVGRVLATLDRLGLARDTLVVFTSDNGGERFSDTWPFSGRKLELLEGGIRVPAIARWPDRVPAGRTSDAMIATMDWLPTLLALAGSVPDATQPPDGIDASAALSGGTLPTRALYWRYRLHGQRAMREGAYKYLRIAGHEFLFDVVADPLERANLRDREPARFAALRERYETWNATMLPEDPAAFSAVNAGESAPDRYGVVRPAAPTR